MPVQAQYTAATTPVTTVTDTFASNTTPGNTLVAYVPFWGSTSPTVAVTDTTTSQAFTQVTTLYNSTWGIAVFYLGGIAGGTRDAVTAVVTGYTSTPYLGLAIYEIAGNYTLDVAASTATGSGGGPQSGANLSGLAATNDFVTSLAAAGSTITGPGSRQWTSDPAGLRRRFRHHLGDRRARRRSTGPLCQQQRQALT